MFCPLSPVRSSLLFLSNYKVAPLAPAYAPESPLKINKHSTSQRESRGHTTSTSIVAHEAEQTLGHKGSKLSDRQSGNPWSFGLKYKNETVSQN